MKKFFAVVLLSVFTVAVCFAGPYNPEVNKHTVEWSKKQLDLQPFEMPASIQVPAAPSVVYDLIVPGITGKSDSVIPQSNSPPKKKPDLKSYSMAFRPGIY